MKIKSNFKYIEFCDTYIIINKFSDTKKILYDTIELVHFMIPKYEFSIGNNKGSYMYNLTIYSTSSSIIKYSDIFERKDEKEIIRILNEKKVKLALDYYNNIISNID